MARWRVTMKRTGPLPAMNQRAWIKVLERHGWTQERGGKHAVKMTKPGHRPITLPDCKRRDYAADLTRRILKEAGLSRADLEG